MLDPRNGGYETIKCSAGGVPMPTLCAIVNSAPRHSALKPPNAPKSDDGTIIAVNFFTCDETRGTKERAPTW